MSAKSVPYAERIASVTRSPISDSHARPSVRPVDAAQASPRGMTTVDLPTVCVEDRRELRCSGRRSSPGWRRSA